MTAEEDEKRTLLVDASVLITLAEIDAIPPLLGISGDHVVPEPVVREVDSDPAATTLGDAIESGKIRPQHVFSAEFSPITAATHLGKSLEQDDLAGYGHRNIGGDIALLAVAIERDDSVVVTDDKPLRKTCKSLSIPVSGSIGVLIRSVERGDIEAEVAREKLYAMDEVGARLSASLVRKAERLIEEAAGE